MRQRYQGENVSKMAEEKDQAGTTNNDGVLPCESNAVSESANIEAKSFMEELVSKIDNEIANGDYVAVEEIEEEDPFEAMVAEGLSQLGRSADGTMQVYLSLTLRDKGLQSIEKISSYTHLQVLDVSHNELEDLTPLSHLSYLISLDASHNQLTTILDFQAPLSLREVNLSNNQIRTLIDLSEHKNLNKLILDYNCITEINGLEHCRRLKILSISNNQIERLNGLEKLPLKYLDLSNNKLKRIENIGSLIHLQFLDLSHNGLRSLRGLQSHDLLDTIKLRYNEIIDLSEVRYIRDLPLLRILDLSYNPIQDFPDYRLSILFRIPRLVELDAIPVNPEEKVASENLFKPRLDIMAARNHMLNLVRSYQQPIKLYNSTLSSTETPYPMLVLTGPSGSGKRTLIKKLCQEFPNFFGEGISYTTRGLRENEKVPRESEVDGTDYHFITKEDFERDSAAGKFISSCHLYNNQFGISREAIETVAKEGLACALHLELEGVMVLKNTHFEPRYILMLPETKKVQEERMRAKKCYSDAHINYAVERVELYVEMNREHPGYFDMVICCDDLEESYRQLKRVVLEYLGLSPATSWSSFTSRGTRETEMSPVTSSDATRAGSTSYEKESLTASAAKPWIRTSSRSRALESNNNNNNNNNLPRSAKSPVEAASIQRRFEMAKAAAIGVTSTSEEQLLKLKPPSSAIGLPSPWGYEEITAQKRSSSAPNGPISSYSKLRTDDDTDSEKETADSDMSSAHADYRMVDENEFEDLENETSYSTGRTSTTSAMS